MAAFLHSGDMGDVVAALPTIEHLANKTGPGMLYLTSRPRTREPMTPARFEFLRPLLAAQPYIKGVEMHKGQKIQHDFTEFREGFTNGVTLAEIQRRHVCPIGAGPKFEKPWLTLPESNQIQQRDIVIARSPRYHNPEWDTLWPRVMNMPGTKGFIGTRDEHMEFEKMLDRPVPYIHVQNALEMAQIINVSGLFIGNQSLPFNIAEGLKVNRILEVSPKARDCEYKGGSVHHVLKAQDWPYKSGTGAFMLALQFYPGDQEAAMQLSDLISDMEPKLRKDVEVAVCPRDDVQKYIIEDVADNFKKSFERVHIIQTMRPRSRGWPDACNDLWQSTMMQLAAMKQKNKTQADAVLTFEPDCVPGSIDWLDRLIIEWRRVSMRNKIAFGHLHQAAGKGKLHINGNMVIDILATRKFPELQTSNREWDLSHGKLFCEHGVHSDLILNRYNDTREYTVDEFMAIEQNGVRPALIHGIKNNSGRICARMYDSYTVPA